MKSFYPCNNYSTIISHMSLIIISFGFPTNSSTFSFPVHIPYWSDLSEIWIWSSYSFAWDHSEMPHSCYLVGQTLIKPARPTVPCHLTTLQPPALQFPLHPTIQPYWIFLLFPSCAILIFISSLRAGRFHCPEPSGFLHHIIQISLDVTFREKHSLK